MRVPIFRSGNPVRSKGGAAVLAILLLLVFSAPAWSSYRPEQSRPYAFADRKTGAPPVWLADRRKNDPRDRYQNLSPAEKEQLQRKYRQWKSMPPDSRKLYQQRFQQWKQLSPNERRQLRQNLDNWDRLSPKEQERIRRRFRD